MVSGICPLCGEMLSMRDHEQAVYGFKSIACALAYHLQAAHRALDGIWCGCNRMSKQPLNLSHITDDELKAHFMLEMMSR